MSASTHRPCGDDCDDRSVMPTGHCCLDGPETRPARITRHLRCITAARAIAAPLVLAVDPAAPPPSDALILSIARALQRHTDPAPGAACITAAELLAQRR